MDRFAPRRPVDNRLSLGTYFRAAEILLKQANIYRREQNVVDLYTLLLRYASLVVDTMPQHRQYWNLSPVDKAHLKRKVVEVVQELESLKPEAELHWKAMRLQIPRLPPPRNDQIREQPYVYNSDPLQEQFRSLPFNIPTPRAETLARHSILSGHRITELPPRIQYPILYSAPQKIDPIDISHVLQPEQNAVQDEARDKENPPSQFDLVNQLAPPPVPAPIHAIEVSAPVVDTGADLALQVNCKEPKKLHMSTRVMDEFMEMARANTVKNIETCGVLAGTLKNGSFFVTTLIIPKQTATTNTCETQNEEEIFEAQDSRGLFQLGWIHTHPTQSCFMSSVDLHTHYSYQVMMQEAIAIVMAPQDSSRKYGIFRLSDPGGITLIQQCPKRGFHAHENTSDGSPIYEKSSHVLLDAKANFDVVDLRK